MGLLLSLLPIVAVVAVLTIVERLRDRERTDWWINLQAWGLMLLIAVTVRPLFQLSGIPSLIDGAALPFWLAFPAYLMIRDLAEYVYHRAQHSIPMLWAMHSLHHSDPKMSALTTQRHFWGDQLVKSVTIWPIAAAIMAPSPAMYAAFAVVSLWNFVAHARLDVNFGRLSWLLNSPAYHRRHHSLLPEHYNSNFAALFPIFDVICGSYYRPDGFPPTGLPHKPESFLDLIVWPLRHTAPEQSALAASKG